MIVSRAARSSNLILTPDTKIAQNFQGEGGNITRLKGEIIGLVKLTDLRMTAYAATTHQSIFTLEDGEGNNLGTLSTSGGGGASLSYDYTGILIKPDVVVNGLKIQHRGYANSGYVLNTSIYVEGVLLDG
ncbi:hypothetical protein [Pseudoteredinibacter isoporae]|uniref:hypothetical protein n=1 Tax=Pseudoteredinibacter isoporae TaxID=570281 RepID=UPI0031090EBB